MTVYELIVELKDYPADYEVFAYNGMGLCDEARIEGWVDDENERIWISS